ncbi:MAG TPA: 16S rRNA (uracil(1498)-N(3))-methyltransferase [Pyrinomonadaceae bacterium]|jgi:16S rRNA (uracil1498-N3)-methyltransferase
MARRFYAPPDAFAPDGAGVVLSAEETAHLTSVLRLRAGDEAFVFDGTGREFRCLIEDVRGRGARLAVSAEVAAARPESPLRLALAVALLKGEKFDTVVQKATELGAACVAPVETARADVRLRDARAATARLARWRRLALEAAKQSGRAFVPAVAAPVALSELLADERRAAGARLFFAERGGRGLAEVCAAMTRPLELTALVGPEGGWADEELAQAEAAGWRLVTLGGRTLRAETAAVVVAALVQHLWGDLR